LETKKQQKSDVFQRFKEFPTRAKKEQTLCVIGLMILKNKLNIDISHLVVECIHSLPNILLLPLRFSHFEAIGSIFADLPESSQLNFVKHYADIISNDSFVLEAVDRSVCLLFLFLSFSLSIHSTDFLSFD